MLTVLLAAAVWTAASVVVAAAFCLLFAGARLSAGRHIEHLERVRPVEAPVAPATPHCVPASFVPRGADDDLASLLTQR